MPLQGMLASYVGLHAEEPVAILCYVLENDVIVINGVFGYTCLYPVKIMFFGQRTRGMFVMKTWYIIPGMFNRNISF